MKMEKTPRLNLAYIRVKDEYQSLTRYMVGADAENPKKVSGLRMALNLLYRNTVTTF